MSHYQNRHTDTGFKHSIRAFDVDCSDIGDFGESVRHDCFHNGDKAILDRLLMR